MKRMLSLLISLLLPALALVSASSVAADDGPALDTKTSAHHTVLVDCDRGKTLERALRRKADHLTIELSGTCTEDITIARDGVTLRGADADATLVGGIRVDSSNRVEISGFTVRDSHVFESCIEAVNGSGVKISDMEIEGCAQRGIRIRDSSGEVRDTTVRNTGDVAFLARGSALTLEGDITAIDSGLVGISITDGSSCFSKSGNLVAHGGSWGVVVQLASSFSLPEGTLDVSNNGAAGVLVASNGSFVYGNQVVSNNNAFAGIWVDESSTFSSFRGFTPELTISGNFFGAYAERSANLELSGNISITGNSYGLVSDESVLRVTGANVTGNFVLDGLLRYGTRANFTAGNTVGVLQCDADVVIRGDVACP